MQTDQWHNHSQSNRTIAFITEQKSLATACPFQEPNLNSSGSKHELKLGHYLIYLDHKELKKILLLFIQISYCLTGCITNKCWYWSVVTSVLLMRDFQFLRYILDMYMHEILFKLFFHCFCVIFFQHYFFQKVWYQAALCSYIQQVYYFRALKSSKNLDILLHISKK